MGKSTKKPGKKQSPSLAAAFFCETIIQDKHDDVLSAIRIIDVITLQLHPSTPEDVPSAKNKLPVSISALLMFKSCGSPGEHSLRIVMEMPSGKKMKHSERVITLPQGQTGGINLRISNVILVSAGGLFLFHVLLNGKRVTQMPLLIKIERAASSEIGSAEKKQNGHKKP